MLRSALLLSPALIAAGCSCNQDYSFPPVETFEADVSEDFGSWLSLDTAPDGTRLTMTYYDRDQSGIGFAVGTPQADASVLWAHEPVDGYPEDDGLDRGDRGRYTSHAVGADGRVWAAYQDVDNGTLRVAVRDGPGNWTHDMADAGSGISATGAGAWASLALQADGNPMVAHHDQESGDLRVSTFDGTSWQNETAVSGDDVGRYANIAIHDGIAYIAYYDGTEGNLGLLEGTPGAWTQSTIDSNGDVGQWPSVWVSGDEVRVAYHDVTQQDLKLARRTAGASWAIETIDNGEFRGADTELFTIGDQPAVVYFDGNNNDMWLARSNNGSWSLEKLGGDDGAVGFHNEVAMAGGVLFAGSYDFTSRTMFMTTIDTTTQ